MNFVNGHGKMSMSSHAFSVLRHIANIFAASPGSGLDFIYEYMCIVLCIKLGG